MKNLNNIVEHVKMTALRGSILGMTIVPMMYGDAYASGDLGSTVQSGITDIAGRGINALAAILAIIALIGGGMSVYDMSQGSKSNNPEQQEKGQRSLTAAIGTAIAAAIMLGIKGTVTGMIQSAMG